MLTPRQLADVPDRILELYAEVEASIIRDMAARLSKMDFIPSAEWQYKKLTEMGYLHDEIVNKLSKALKLSNKEIEQLMIDSGVKAISADSKIYRKAGLDPPILNASPALQAVLQAGIDNTNGLFQNLTRTTANTATKQFEDILDRAWLQINSGTFDYNSAIRMAVKDLASKGIKSITYPNGHTDYLDVAVRRATVTGVNQTALKLQEKLADEVESDLVEVTAHSGARPTHAEWQGKIFSRLGTHPKYPSLREGTGYGTGAGLGGWNCRHSFFPYFEGMDSVHTQAELDDMNAKKYEYNGEKLTEYEATQKQRAIERNIRKWKRENIGMEASGQPTAESASKLAHWQEKQKDFLKQTGLKRQYDRENVEGFGRSEAGKVKGQLRQSETLAKQSRAEYNNKQEGVHSIIRSPDTPKMLNIGNQNKHIKDSKGYISGRSYIFGDSETAQSLVDQYHGTGEPRFTRKGDWTKKEYVKTNSILGVVVDMDTLEETETTAGLIHYGKKGTHIVPTKEAIIDDT